MQGAGVVTNEPQAVDWDEAGDCRSCAQPLEERPPRTCWNKGEHCCNARHGGAIARCDLRRSDCLRLEADERAARLGVQPAKVNMTAGDVMKGIRRMHATPPSKAPEWLVLTEVALAGVKNNGDATMRFVDAMAVRLFTGRGLELHAFEVKVSRGDWANELKQPAKRAAAMEASTHFWIAAPVGLVRVEEVPIDCGLVEFGKGPRGPMHTRTVQAPGRRVECVPDRMIWTLAWRLRDMERRLQGRGVVL